MQIMTSGEKQYLRSAETNKDIPSKIRQYIGMTAVASTVAYGCVGLINHKHDIEKPFAPDSVIDTTEIFARELGSSLHILSCPDAPTDQESRTIIENTSALRDEVNVANRYTIAEKLNLTIVPAEEVTKVTTELIDTTNRYIYTNEWPDKLTEITNDFMGKYYGVRYEYEAPNSPAVYPKVPEYATRLIKFVENVGALPTEIFTNTDLEKISVRSTDMGDADGSYNYAKGTIKIEWEDMHDVHVLIHELQHSVDRHLCTPGMNNSEKVLRSINPPGTVYNPSAKFEDDYDPTAFANGYSMKSAEEDVAEAAVAWTLTADKTRQSEYS